MTDEGKTNLPLKGEVAIVLPEITDNKVTVVLHRNN